MAIWTRVPSNDVVVISTNLIQCTAYDFGQRIKSEHFHDLVAPILSVRPADILQTLWTCYCLASCRLVLRCVHSFCAFLPVKQTVGLSIHTSIVCSKMLFSSSCKQFLQQYRCLYCNTAGLSTPLLCKYSTRSNKINYLFIVVLSRTLRGQLKI